MGDRKIIIETGVTLGNIAAAAVSYSVWGSIPWAAFHALFGWFYVIYYGVKYLI